ncbi:MAG: adenine-specific methylase [Rhodoglobus sp.]|nr:adenine-specific methylase [Rhodoglobus sp.]
MGVRYIGSKARVAEAIVDLAGPPDGGRFVDAFSGTGAVAAVAANRGWAVTVNDSLPSAVSMSVGAIVGLGNVSFARLGGYFRAVEMLNAVTPHAGFLHAEYSPASKHHSGVERKYFTEANAAKLDAMRSLIRRWDSAGEIDVTEEHLLLADLMQAANGVANISGTYGCFLKDWTSTALRSVSVVPRFLPQRTTDVVASVKDVFAVPTTTQDTVYFDPPYTKRQYSAYYHLLETLHAGDSPDVGGVTGLRPWQSKASDFSYKTRALDALTRLVLGTKASRVLLSYSNEGHVHQAHLVNALTEAGSVTLHPIQQIGRYRPNARASASGDTVSEYVIEVMPVQLNVAAINEPIRSAATA